MKNAYLLFALILLAGCDGIEVTLEPGQPIPATKPATSPVNQPPARAEMTIYGEKVEKTFTGKVVSIADGDMITVLNDANEQVKIRLASIDCPKKNQPFGKVAKDAIGRIHGMKVTIFQTDKDRWGQIVGFVILPDGKNVNVWLIQEGLAWHYKDYSSSPVLAELENKARMARAGLWAGNGPEDQVPPWDWRKRQFLAFFFTT